MASLRKNLAPAISLVFLLFFLWGMGKDAFFPSLRLISDTQWDLSLFPVQIGKKIVSLFWLIPISLGFLGWIRALKITMFQKTEPRVAWWVGFGLVVCFFSIYVFGLAVNGILVLPLVLLFFLPVVLLKPQKMIQQFQQSRSPAVKPTLFLLLTAGLLWVFEYFSPPLIWDAVLDHFNYAREVARLHILPFHWTNHTGEMPKFAELILAGFWTLGGESLSKLSLGLGALLFTGLLYILMRDWKVESRTAFLLLWISPFFLALFSWGYVEGFLTAFALMALYCLWKIMDCPNERIWILLMPFFLGAAFSVKYTAVLVMGGCLAVLIWDLSFSRKLPGLNWKTALLFLLPCFPWLLKNYLSNGNPFYPLAVSWLGGPPGYDLSMESALWQDTGRPTAFSVRDWGILLWKSFFTPHNGIAAAWTPLVAMSLPWIWSVLKKREGERMGIFILTFFSLWLLFCTNLRHAATGLVVLTVMGALAWQIALKDKRVIAKSLFAAGCLLSLWLMVCAQLTVTAPYASALGLENPLSRLKRHYVYDMGTFSAYHFIEANSDIREKVMAFAVYQTYPLQRAAFVDFKWKMPIFLKWASSCKTAEELAFVFKKEGVSYFLYQSWEATAMAKMEKDFRLESMSVSEYERFWECFMKPVAEFGDTFVYRVLEQPGPALNNRFHPKFNAKGEWVQDVAS